MQAAEPVAPHADARAAFASAVRTGEIIELSHPMDRAMPVYPYHVPFTLTLNRRHGDPHPRPRLGDSSFSNELIVMSAHTATHIDALGHFSRCGHVHGGAPAESIETPNGLSRLDVADIQPVWRPAVLFDIAGQRGVESLAPADEVTVADLEACARRDKLEIRPGDVALIRTGWSAHWRDSATFNGSRGGLPGPGRDGTQWLVDQGVSMVGSDTPAFEVIPSVGDSVHAMLLVDRNIHIIENLQLDEVAQRRAHRFLFVALPLRMVGATGSPLRPIAVL